MKLFVISDLHLGGRPHQSDQPSQLGSQICHAYGELTQFIDYVAKQGTAELPVELVINGDIVDFLMEDDYGEAPDGDAQQEYAALYPSVDTDTEAAPWTPDEDLVLRKLRIIIERTREVNERGPFEAMADLLAAGQRLTFILGNHDVELSLPAVRRFLETDVLHMEIGNQFRFVYDGEAYVRGDLLIEHGNRYDPWNVVDYSALRQERSMLSRGLRSQISERKTGQFTPPPGSVMVAKVINQLKRDYRFVDLLKPEDWGVIPILLALHPTLEPVLKAILRLYDKLGNQYRHPSEPEQDGQLSANESDSPFALSTSLRMALGEEDAQLFGLSGDTGTQLSFTDAWSNVKDLSRNIPKLLKNGKNVFDASYEKGRYVLLLKGLRAWRGNLAIDQSKEDPRYLSAIQEMAMANRFKYVVFGHTHLPKYIPITGDDAEQPVTYINTGTWADIMVVPPEVLESDDVMAEPFRQFMQDLKTNQLDNYIDRCLSYAEIELQGESVVSAQLNAFKPTSGSATSS